MLFVESGQNIPMAKRFCTECYLGKYSVFASIITVHLLEKLL